MYKIILLILSLCVIPTVLANDAPDNPGNPGNMDTVAKAILPLLFDTHQSTQTNAVNMSEQLNKHLAELQLIFQQAAFKNMSDTVEQAQKNLEQKNEAKARELIKTTLAFCLASNPNPDPEINLGSMRFASPFELAEYHYITQNYQEAITYYDHYLTNKKQAKSKEQTQLALERLLSIYTQLEKDPSIAAAYLNEYTDYIAHNPELKVVLQQWVHDLNNIHAYFDDVFQTEKPITFLNIQNYATRILKTPEANAHPETEKVKRIVLRGMIFNHLNETTPNEKEKPLLIEWLALCY